MSNQIDLTGSKTDGGPELVSESFDANESESVAGFTVVGRVVNWNNSPSFTQVTVLLEASSTVRPAQFLGVLHDQGQALTTLQVGNSFEVNPNEIPELAAARSRLGLSRSYGTEGVSTRIFRLAECTAMEEFKLVNTDGGQPAVQNGHSPELLVRAGDLVVLLTSDIVVASLGTLANPNKGLALGATGGTDVIPITVKPEALQFHLGIFGNPGQGKSYLTGAILEEAVAWNVPSLVLDINGEFVRAASQLGGTVITLPDSKEFGLSLNRITPQELVSIAPNVQPGTQYAELIENAHHRLRNDTRGKTITFDDLRKAIEAEGAATKTGQTSINVALARVSALQNDPIIGAGFDFVKKLEEHRLVVLDCRYLSLRQTQLIAAMGARELQAIGRERARKAEEGDTASADWFALYFVDEAHAVIPNDEHVVSTQVHLELARMGRHVRTGLVLSSQSPADLHSSVLKRLQLRFVFALERDQLRSIQGVIADLDERIVAQLPKLPRGTCAVSGSNDLVRHGFLLDVRERRTHAGGNTPRVFGMRSKKPTSGSNGE